MKQRVCRRCDEIFERSPTNRKICPKCDKREISKNTVMDGLIKTQKRVNKQNGKK